MKRTIDVIGTATMSFYLAILFFVQVAIVLPSYTDASYTTYTSIVGVLFAMVMISFVQLRRNQCTISHRILPPIRTAEMEGWKYCYDCQANVPPRSYHCKMCNICVLKRQMHSFVGGCCVGYKNLRFMSSFTFYLIVLVMFSQWLLWPVLLQLVGGADALLLLALFLPHIGVFFKGQSLTAFLALFTTHTSLYVLLISAFFLFKCWRAATTALTDHELHVNDRHYRLPFWIALRDTFGNRFPFAFFLPFLPSPPLNDGIEFDSTLKQI